MLICTDCNGSGIKVNTFDLNSRRDFECMAGIKNITLPIPDPICNRCKGKGKITIEQFFRESNDY